MFSRSKSFLRQIHPESGKANNAVVDVVAVHGLDPNNKKDHAYNTWTDNGKLWLRDFLPTKAGTPELRVLLFGYSSTAAFQSSTVGIASAGVDLLKQLHLQRREHSDRPIVFVCHSLGGIVVKQALVEAHNAGEVYGTILESTRGITFFATPHGDFDGAKLGDTIVRVLHALTGDVRNDTMEWLRTDSFLSNQLDQNFARRAKNIRVVSFMENLPVTGHFGLVLPQSSARLNWPEPAETRLLMEANHNTICKFPSQEDYLYVRVADQMLDLIVWAAQPTKAPSPNLSISRLSIDIPPPPYALEFNLSPVYMNPEFSVASLRQSPSPDEPLSSPTGNTSNSKEIALGGLHRIPTASAVQPASPRLASRPQLRSTDDGIAALPETQHPVWPIVVLPHQRNANYVHRSELWKKLIAMMNKAAPILLQGFGGCGKTQTAVYLSYWFRDKNPGASIMWINATSPDTSLAGLGLIASRMGIKNVYGESQRLMTLKDRLERPSSGYWLMVFDAADSIHSYDAFKDFIPRCLNGQVLITSRENPMKKDAVMQDFVFDLSALSAFEGATLVHMSMDASILAAIDPPDMDRLLRKLDYLALAITQAVAFMNKNSMSLKLYLAKISDQNSISEDNLWSVPPAVYSTLKLSFARLASEKPEALRILECLSFFENRLIPADLVNLVISSQALNDQPLADLETSSFIQWSPERTSLDLKRLVQAAVQRWLQETGQSDIHKISILEIMSKNFPDAALSSLWVTCEAWLPHALKVIELCDRDIEQASIETPSSAPSQMSATSMTKLSRAIIQLKAKVGFYYYRMGRWTIARDYLEEALDLSRYNFGTMDSFTLHIQADLVQTLRYLGQLQRANEIARDLKRARKAKLGKKDKDTLDSYRICALTFQDLGKWKDSLDASEKALAGYREIYKSDPIKLEILRLCRRTAWICIALGQYSRAETLLQQAILGYRKRKELESEPAADCFFALAVLKLQMKRFAEGEVAVKDCLRVRKSLMKADHPDVLKAYWIKGVSLQGQHIWDDAEKLFNNLLDQAQNRPGIGRKHMYSLTLLYSLGTLEEERAIEDEAMLGEGAGRDGLFKAKATLNEVLIGRTEVFGPDHLETLTTKARLAGIQRAIGDLDTADKESNQVLEIVNTKEYRGLGFASMVIIWMCLSTLAECAGGRASKFDRLPSMDKERKQLRKMAVTYAKQVAEGLEKILEKGHPDTANAARAWVAALHAADDTKTAAKVMQRFGVAVPTTDDFTVITYKGLQGH